MIANTITTFKRILIHLIKKINNKLKSRVDKVASFRDIIYYSSLIVGNNSTYDIVNSELQIHNILNVSKKTLITTKNKLDNKYIGELNDGLIKHIYESVEKRIIGIDGTNICLLKSLQDDFQISSNGKYCNVLINTLFDLEREIPINYYLSKAGDERNALTNQLGYLKKNDIVVMDRGYYSKKILYQLTQIGVNVMFRLRTTLKILKKIDTCDDYIARVRSNGTTMKLRIIKYIIDDTEYYIGTTLYEESIENLKNLYWQRWKIETHFRYAKQNLSLLTLESKSENTVRQDIFVHCFVFIVGGYSQYLLQSQIDTKHKINTTNHLHIVVNEILYLFLYEKSTEKNIANIMRILDISKKNTILIKNNRSCERVKLRTINKWCSIGNRYKTRQ